jgi:hypothetical protein
VALGIPRYSINCKLGTLPSGQVENRKISPGEEGTSYWRVGLAVSFIYGAWGVRVRAVKEES